MKSPQQTAYEAAKRLHMELEHRDRENARARLESNEQDGDPDPHGTYANRAPKDTLHALQLLITAAALMQPKKPVGRPRQTPRKGKP